MQWAAAMLPGILCAAAGMGIGCLVRRLKQRRRQNGPQ